MFIWFGCVIVQVWLCSKLKIFIDLVDVILSVSEFVVKFCVMIVDIGIIGLGVMGSVVVWLLVLCGVIVLGVDCYLFGYVLGLLYGKMWIIWFVYFEGNIYDVLVDEVYVGWDCFEWEFGQVFFCKIGGLDIFVRVDGIFQEVLVVVKISGKLFEVLEGQVIEQCFLVLDFNGCG